MFRVRVKRQKFKGLTRKLKLSQEREKERERRRKKKREERKIAELLQKYPLKVFVI